MSRQVTISDQVTALLRGYGEQVHQMLRRPMRCNDCQRAIGPHERVCVSVEVYASSGPGQPENLRVFVTHPRCAPSRVRAGQLTLEQVAALLAASGGSDVDRVMVLRPDDHPSGLVIWEPVTKTYSQDNTGADPISLPLASSLAHGFTLLCSLDGLDRLPPALPGWRAELDSRRLVVRNADGLPALDTGTDGAPHGWVEAGLDQQVLIALTGVDLGLDAPSWERLEAAAGRGQLAGAIIRLAHRR